MLTGKHSYMAVNIFFRLSSPVCVEYAAQVGCQMNCVNIACRYTTCLALSYEAIENHIVFGQLYTTLTLHSELEQT